VIEHYVEEPPRFDAVPWRLPTPEESEGAVADEILRRAATRIRNRRHWTKRAFYRDGFGSKLGLPDHDSHDFIPEGIAQWCALGAIAYEADRFDVRHTSTHELVCDRLRDALGCNIASVNDGLFGHWRIMRGFAKALGQR
jgi:hypothetical protein